MGDKHLRKMDNDKHIRRRSEIKGEHLWKPKLGLMQL